MYWANIEGINFIYSMQKKILLNALKITGIERKKTLIFILIVWKILIHYTIPSAASLLSFRLRDIQINIM